MAKHAHFIGIAGKGMSATALLLKQLGWKISGSDTGFYPPVSTFLERAAIPFHTAYKAENIPADADLIVIGKNAKLVPETNEEVKAAFESGKTVRSFPEVLEGLVEGKHNIVVAGSYGKSTVTALLAWILQDAGKEPSYFIGEIARNFPMHAHIGNGKAFVLEGDEYPSANWDGTSKFLYYHPTDVLLTSAEHDHVNVFHTHEAFLAVFKTLLSLIPQDGLLVASADDESSRALAMTHTDKKVLYGINAYQKSHEESYDSSYAFWSAKNIAYGDMTTFTLTKNGEPIVELKTSLLGKHNIQNIVGVATLLLEKQLVTPEELAHGVESFLGVERRLILLSPNASVAVYEGFGSSYTKARTAIDAMQLHFPNRRLVIVFEPHQALWRSREMIHWYDTVFKGVDKIFIYKPPTHWLTEHQLSLEEILNRVHQAGQSAIGFETTDQGLQLLEEELQSNDIVLILTSGGMDGLIQKIPELADTKFPK